MKKRLRVLVAGATGKQGGATARALLKRGHQVSALTRDPGSDAAQQLAQLGASVVVSELEDRTRLAQLAQGMDVVFGVTIPSEPDYDKEAQQGINLVDAARSAEVAHFVFVSAACANLETGIAHFAPKRKVELHLESTGIMHTIVGGTFFMENFHRKFLGPRDGKLALGLGPDSRRQYVSSHDIGTFAALIMEDPVRFGGLRIDLASDELTGPEVAAIISKYSDRQITWVPERVEDVKLEYRKQTMIWMDRVGFGVNIRSLRASYPEVAWQTFDNWASTQDWSALRKPTSNKA